MYGYNINMINRGEKAEEFTKYFKTLQYIFICICTFVAITYCTLIIKLIELREVLFFNRML